MSSAEVVAAVSASNEVVKNTLSEAGMADEPAVDPPVEGSGPDEAAAREAEPATAAQEPASSEPAAQDQPSSEVRSTDQQPKTESAPETVMEKIAAASQEAVQAALDLVSSGDAQVGAEDTPVATEDSALPAPAERTSEDEPIAKRTRHAAETAETVTAEV
eukprot:jgi/Mesvir1/27014/Mv20721-RA.1